MTANKTTANLKIPDICVVFYEEERKAETRLKTKLPLNFRKGKNVTFTYAEITEKQKTD